MGVTGRQKAVEELAAFLHFTLERFDPTDDPEWVNLTPHQKRIYTATIEQILSRRDLLSKALEPLPFAPPPLQGELGNPQC